MNITKQDISQFQRLYKKYFNEDLGKDQARGDLMLLLNLIKATYRPITKDQLAKLVETDLQESSEDL